MAALPLVLKHKSQRGMRSVRSSTLLGEGPQKGILDYGGSGSVVWAPGTAFVHARAPVRVRADNHATFMDLVLSGVVGIQPVCENHLFPTFSD